jgi:hypothetical protein
LNLKTKLTGRAVVASHCEEIKTKIKLEVKANNKEIIKKSTVRRIKLSIFLELTTLSLSPVSARHQGI